MHKYVVKYSQSMEKIKFINKHNLMWARKKSGFDMPYIYKQAGWKSEGGKIEKWEEGSDFPTISNLRTLGKIYKRPWTLFIIEENADDLDFKFLEFRKIFHDKEESVSPHLLKFLNDLKGKQDFLIEFADALDLNRNRIVGLCKGVTNEKDMAEKIIAYTDIDMNVFWKKNTRRDGFNYLAECLERKNIFVSSTSSNHHQTIPLDQMRGVLLNSDIAPIIGINTKNESYGARIFTIFHELTHLLKGDSFSGDIEVTKINFRNRQGPKDSNESFCDAVAAKILVPDAALNEIIKNQITARFIETKCKKLKVNHEPLLYRMQEFGLLNRERVNELLLTLKEDKIVDEKAPDLREDKRGPDGGYLKLLQNGKAFIHAVNMLHSIGEITFTQALNVLDIKGKTYKKFARRI